MAAISNAWRTGTTALKTLSVILKGASPELKECFEELEKEKPSMDFIKERVEKNPNLCKEMASEGHLLDVAASNGHLEVVKYLVPISPREGSNCHPLHRAASEGHVECASFLLEAGFKLEATLPTRGATPLFWAAEHGSLEAVKFLVQKGANIETRGWRKGEIKNETPDEAALANGHKEVAEFLQVQRSVHKGELGFVSDREARKLMEKPDLQKAEELLTMSSIVGSNDEEVEDYVRMIQVLKEAGCLDRLPQLKKNQISGFTRLRMMDERWLSSIGIPIGAAQAIVAAMSKMQSQLSSSPSEQMSIEIDPELGKSMNLCLTPTKPSSLWSGRISICLMYWDQERLGRSCHANTTQPKVLTLPKCSLWILHRRKRQTRF